MSSQTTSNSKPILKQNTAVVKKGKTFVHHKKVWKILNGVAGFVNLDVRGVESLHQELTDIYGPSVDGCWYVAWKDKSLEGCNLKGNLVHAAGGWCVVQFRIRQLASTWILDSSRIFKEGFNGPRPHPSWVSVTQLLANKPPFWDKILEQEGLRKS